MNISEPINKMFIITLPILCICLFLLGCGTKGNGVDREHRNDAENTSASDRANGHGEDNESNWVNGHGELSNKIGDPEAVDPNLVIPPQSDFLNVKDVFENTEYNEPTGKWFMHNGKGMFGYGLSSGTKEVGADLFVSLIGHDKEGVRMDRDVRIQLSAIDESLKQLELVFEDIVHVQTVTNEEEIYTSQLPNKENVTYLLSMEILDEQNDVEDTMVSMIYVPAPEINVKLTINQDVYKKSDQEAAFTLENFGPTFLSFGKHYSIEKKVNGNWKVVPLDIMVEEIAIYIRPYGSYKQTIDITELTPGRHRIVKMVHIDGIDLSATLAAEFMLE